MLSDEIDEEKRGTKVPRTRRRKSQPARWGADWSSERSSYRVIDGRKPKGEIRSRNSRTQDIEGGNSGSRGAGHRTPSGDYSAEEMPDTGHRGQMSAEPKSGSNPDEMDGEGTAFAKHRQLPRRKSQMAPKIGCTFTMPVGESVSMIQSRCLVRAVLVRGCVKNR